MTLRFDPTEAVPRPSDPRRRRKSLAWVLPASALIHAVVAWLFLFGLPLDLPEPPAEDSVAVELVPPPEEKPEEKPDAAAETAAKQPRVRAAEERGEEAAAKGGGDPMPVAPQTFESTGQADEAPAEEEKASAETPLPETTPIAAADASPAGESDEKTSTGAAQTIEADPRTGADGSVAASETAVARGTGEAQPVKGLVKDASGEKPEKSTEVVQKPQPQLTEVKTLFSDKTISDPRVKKALGQLAPNRRLVQICSIEALEQVRQARPQAFPDMMVPFSSGGGLISGPVLNATGGAYRSAAGWHGIDFSCEADADVTKVVSFRLRLGAAIPPGEWKGRKLPAQ